jgi:hypothetical protein
VDIFYFGDDSTLSVAGMIVGIVVGSLVAITIIVLAVIMINKVKASRVQVSSVPSRCQSVEMHGHMSQHTVNAHDIVIHGRNLHSFDNDDDEGIDMRPADIQV